VPTKSLQEDPLMKRNLAFGLLTIVAASPLFISSSALADDEHKAVKHEEHARTKKQKQYAMPLTAM
jgi:hypothetical protein